VVMMLDIDFEQLRRGVQDYLLLGAGVGILLACELLLILFAWQSAPLSGSSLAHATPLHVTNTEALGRILYTDYVYYFQTAGLVLLVAMIGAIVLTLRQRPGVRRQSIKAQNARTPAMSMDVKDVLPGQGS